MINWTDKKTKIVNNIHTPVTSQCVYFHFRALKNAQAKLRSQQNVNAQLEEQRRREEVRVLSRAAYLIIHKLKHFC